MPLFNILLIILSLCGDKCLYIKKQAKIILPVRNLNGEFNTFPKKFNDPFFAKDKVKHFAFGFFSTHFVYQEMKFEMKAKEKESLMFSIAIPIILSFTKEFKDKKDYGLFSFKDLFWGIAGTIFATSLIIVY